MSPRPAGRRAAIVAASLLITAAWGLLLGLHHLQGRGSFLDRIEDHLEDWRFLIAGPRPAPDGIVVVAIDDATVRAAGSYPLPRSVLATLVRQLAASGAKAIALDMLFLDHGPGQGDAELADALRGTKTIVGAVALFSGTDTFLDTPLGVDLSVPLPVADKVMFPIDPIARAAAVGLVNIAADQSGSPRYVPLLMRAGTTLLPSFAMRTAAVATGVDPEIATDAIAIGPAQSRIDLGYHLPLRFYGGRGTIRTISARSVLEGNVDVRDRIVVVGVTAIGTADTFATAFDPVFPGVELAATAIAQLVTGQGLIRDIATRRIDLLACVLVPVLTVLALSFGRIGRGMVLAMLPILVWLVVALLAFNHGYWLTMTTPVAVAIPPALLFGGLRLLGEQKAKQRLSVEQQTLRRFHSPAMADTLAANPAFLQQPVRQDAPILFVDLSGFTGLSERLGPNLTHVLLKEFHTIIEEEATRHDGFVTAFMGDGAMLLFGIPARRPDDAERAIRTAFALGAALRAWIAGNEHARDYALGLRVGVHQGPVVLSRLGSETHQHITATGDTVNVASRLLEVASQSRCEAVFSLAAVTAAGCEKEIMARGFVGPRDIAIRGRSEPLSIVLGNLQAEENPQHAA